MTLEAYGGYEQGPIRPPSEAGSLLLRVTRNCPWNRCKFCPVYKGAEFSGVRWTRAPGHRRGLPGNADPQRQGRGEAVRGHGRSP